MLALADMMHLLANELSGLRTGRLPLTSVFVRAFKSLFIWHRFLLLT
jgi:hypothetical protein